VEEVVQMQQEVMQDQVEVEQVVIVLLFLEEQL
jgi:hypothetical protein